MHHNLERRFIRLAVARGSYSVALECFRIRYHLLFDAMAIERGWKRETLARQLGFAPVPEGGNDIMNGKAEPSNEDCAKLLEMYLEHNAKKAKKP